MQTRPPLVRAHDDRIIAGVCAGLAAHLKLPVAWVRVGMAIALAIGGAGGVLYVFFLLTVPQEGETASVPPLRRFFTFPNDSEGSLPGQAVDSDPLAAPSRRRLPIAEFLLGGSFLIAGLSFLLVQLGVQLRLEVILPGLAVLVGVGLAWWLIADRDQPERHPLPRILGALALVAVGVIMFFITAREPTVLSVIGAAVAVLAGVALAIAPWVLRINRELGAERSARARATERTEIAAHLHDSVLQTLALIQQRSDPSTEVARLARGQERDLREWLFHTADGPVPRDRENAYAELGEHARALEEVHPVRFEVVAVGERVVAPEEIIAAAREAMQNAARHARGEVTVYLETAADSVRIEVNDRGPGFRVEEISESRFGVRESIIGRMERVDGSARILPGPGGQGVSVRLQQLRSPRPATTNGGRPE